MHRFPFLETQGAALAVISDLQDGNCSGHAPSMPNRRAVLEQCGTDLDALVCPKQVHGIQILPVRKEAVGRDASGQPRALGEADGLITDVPGLPLGVAVADCVPLFLFDPVRRVIGLLHAGRKGTQANMAGEGVAALIHTYGVRPQNLYAVIGPSAGPCCYEVSPELSAEFQAAGWFAQGRRLDLWATNRRQLLQAGVPEAHVEISAHCTICSGRYHSFRAHSTAARNLAILML